MLKLITLKITKMCGIVTIKKNKGGGKKNKGRAYKAVLKRFQKQRSRGTEGFGYIAIQNGKIVSVERTKTESEIIWKLKKETTNEIIFHHRNPTSTPNHEDTAHPITIKEDQFHSNYYVIHNGHISNASELRTQHELFGLKYTTDMSTETVITTRSGKKTTEKKDCFNDSESFAMELALYLENIRHVIDTKGSVAFVCVETDKEDNVLRIHYGRNDGTSPLVVEENKGLFSIKSTGQGTDIPPNNLYTLDYVTNNIDINKVNIGETWKSRMGYNSNNDEEVKNIYNSNMDYTPNADDYGDAFQGDKDKDKPNTINLLKSPYAINKDRELVYNKEGQCVGSADKKDKDTVFDNKIMDNEEQTGVEAIKKSYVDKELEKLQSWIEEEADLAEELKEAQEELQKNAHGVEVLDINDILFYQEVVANNQEQIIMIRADIEKVEWELQDID